MIDPVLNEQEVIGETAAEPGVTKVWEVDWYPVKNDGVVDAVGVNVRDVTKYVVMEKELRRVMRELQHRVKNMLSNVLALINRACREEGNARSIMERLVSRIQALANTHDLLTRRNWDSAELFAILEPELLEVYGHERIALKGAVVDLGSKATVNLSMTLHELATNAAKYGALSNDGGHLTVTWSKVDDGSGDKLIVEWTESGGPAVRPPERRGFGSELIASTIESSLGGEVVTTFDADGLCCIFRIPMANLKDRTVAPGATRALQ